MRTLYSAFIRSHSHSTPSTTTFTPRSERGKPRSKAASPSRLGTHSALHQWADPDRRNRSQVLGLQATDAAAGRPLPRQLYDRGRSRRDRAPGDTMTIVGACRDALRVICAEPGAQPEYSMRLRFSLRDWTKSGTTDGAGTHSSTRTSRPWFTPKNLSQMTA